MQVNQSGIGFYMPIQERILYLCLCPPVRLTNKKTKCCLSFPVPSVFSRLRLGSFLEDGRYEGIPYTKQGDPTGNNGLGQPVGICFENAYA